MLMLLTALAVIGACATPRSNARVLEGERLSVLVVPTRDSAGSGEALAPTSIESGLLGLGKRLVEALLSAEAERFAAVSTGSCDFNWSEGSRDRPITILAIRTVEAKRVDLESHSALDDPLLGLPLITSTTPTTLGAEIAKVAPDFDGVAFQQSWKALKLGNDQRVVTFAVVFELRPDRTQPSLWRLHCLGYYYGALTAKNFRVSIPFTDYSRTESLVSIALDGPDGVPLYPLGRYAVSAKFPVSWDRDVALEASAHRVDGSYEFERIPSSEQAWARAWTKPPFGLLTVRVTVSEASSMADALERLGRTVKDADL
ncbi:MAG: hypothetical protein IT453_21180 [Planctomycetes bacterium]|nr:hypothetical protein [Planctomycetota bacterium]